MVGCKFSSEALICTAPLTVGELKKALEKYPDDWKVCVPDPEGVDKENYTIADVYHAHAGSVDVERPGWVRISVVAERT